MLISIAYQLQGAEQTQTTIGIRAQVGWELRTKGKITDLANGLTTTAMVGLLLEQLRADAALPDGVVNEATLAAQLVDLNPVADETDAATPTDGAA